MIYYETNRPFSENRNEIWEKDKKKLYKVLEDNINGEYKTNIRRRKVKKYKYGDIVTINVPALSCTYRLYYVTFEEAI